MVFWPPNVIAAPFTDAAGEPMLGIETRKGEGNVALVD